MKSRCIITHHSSPSHLPTKTPCSKPHLPPAPRSSWHPARHAWHGHLPPRPPHPPPRWWRENVSWFLSGHWNTPMIVVEPCRSSINLPIHLLVQKFFLKEKACYCLRKHRRPGSPSFRLPSWQFLTCTRSRLCSEASLAAARPPKAAASWEAQAISNQISTPSGWIPL